ncbi:importin alpha, putative [Perkinsus marinus ATCC 50983]|uniref:Importin subunit alpha n=1 Tax=Perkinsus marinus (strain ATCC 50983 / TXsc) TaxID=423536 RepID=C5LHY9_PERM5|nr:importin alpha, putative [Perkinsus marinus ATCC 50983]EER03743.1 importin alpha, putative [Perkinsus marinus ATCC 50983]|eukprot:XP_002771927.1 importin alpha, putative [Perkinsus marinus ATCC 50983]
MSNIEDRIAARRKNYKKTGDFEDSRRRREDEAVQIRKAEKEKQLAHRRRMDMEATQLTSNAQSGSSGMPNLAELQEAVIGCNAADPDTQFKATQYVRRLLSIEKNPPIQYVIDAGVVPRMVTFLQDTQRPKLQFEAAWVLTNIASGTRAQTETVVAAGTIPLFIALLGSPDAEVREQAVWALGNIAGDSPRLRDMVLDANVLPGMMNLFNDDSDKFSLFRNATWALSNLCRGKPQPPLQAVAPALPLLSQLINSNDVEVITDACWALSYVTDGPSERIQAVLDTGACPRLVELLKHDSSLVQTPALRSVGNIVTGDDNQTQQVLNCGGLASLHALLYSPKKNLRKEACWSISNITAGNREQIQECINSGMFGKLIELLTNAEFDVKKEAAWSVSNATAGGTPEQVDYLVQNGCIKPLCDLLDVTDTKIVGCCLEGIDNILRVGVLAQERNPDLAENPYLHLIEEADGMTKIEDLQADQNDVIYEKAVHILESYFPVEEDDEDGSLEDMDSTNTGFATAGSSATNQQPTGGFHF